MINEKLQNEDKDEKAACDDKRSHFGRCIGVTAIHILGQSVCTGYRNDCETG
jgi:hypothetical protein